MNNDAKISLKKGEFFKTQMRKFDKLCGYVKCVTLIINLYSFYEFWNKETHRVSKIFKFDLLK